MKHIRSSRPGRTFVLALLVIALGAACSQVMDARPFSATEPQQNRLTTAAATYPIVDTGQTRCYNNTAEITCPSAAAAFYGQDAQYTGNAPSYQDNGDGAVTDLVTGLMWQQSPDRNGDGVINYSDKLYYDEAVALAASFDLAGYDDWRLPTIKELYSLIMFYGVDLNPQATSGTTPFINTEYFDFGYGDLSAGERIIDAQYASSTLYVSTTMQGNRTMFGVNFADGRIKGYPADQSFGKKYYVLYVRGDTTYGMNQFVDNGDGTITDNATGLMWMQADNGAGLLWEDALGYAEGFEYAGYTDWRLPNAKELQSLVDYTRSPATTDSAAIDPLFDSTPIVNEAGETDYPFYWTSTTHSSQSPSSGSEAVYISFGRAMGYMSGLGGWMDVHGAGAQRSDPKEGNPANYPTGRGPQGDAIRIYNYVRLVRDVPKPQSYLPVIIAQAGGDVALTWTDDPANTGGYQIWWSAEPYSVPGASGSDYAVAPASPYIDGGVVGTTRYYVVLGMNDIGQTVSESNRVGILSLSLTPGEAL